MAIARSALFLPVRNASRETQRRSFRRKMKTLRLEQLEQRSMLTAGANLAFYEFTNHASGNPELFSSDAHLETTASDISSPLALGWTGNGQPPNGLALGGAFNETSEPTPAGGQPDYFEFSIVPEHGYLMNVATFSMQVRRNDPDSKNSFAVYFDEDPGSGGNNYATKILSGVITSEDRFDRFSVDTESIAELQGLTTEVTFRVYAWGTAGTGTMRLDNIRVQTLQETASQSKYAYYGDAGRLIMPLDALGNRVPDFSNAGYMYGDAEIPDIQAIVDASRVVTLAPADGDDMANIQAAIDQVGQFEPDANGFRGIVQLTAGEFQISNQVRVLQSGVVLRGVGDGEDPAQNTILRGTGTLRRSLVVLGEAQGFVTPQSGTTHNVTDTYVPVGATSFQVDSTEGWSVGDEVVVMRPSTEEWIRDIGMDSIPPRGDGGTTIQWEPGGNYDQPYERVITRLEGNRVFINAPLTNALEQRYGGGTVFKYTFPRIQQLGVEGIRGVSDFTSDTDEDHARSFIEIQAAEHVWVRDVTGVHFVYATVHATARSRMVTVDGATSLDPKSIITGGRRYPFVIDGQLTVMKNLFSEEGRHDFVNNSAWRNRGPNVFLNGTAVNSHSSTGPHQRWSTGTLYDTVVTDNQIEARNRGNFGTGHGWGGANMVFWNTVAESFIVQNPPTAQNWVIGSTGTLLNETRFGPQPPATVDSHDTPIDFGRADNPTGSLYVAQWNQRKAHPWEKREYVLGDFDQASFEADQDAPPVDAAWKASVESLGSGQLRALDEVRGDSAHMAATIGFAIADVDLPQAAVLTLGLRGTGSDPANDLLWIEDIASARTMASLGVQSPLTADVTTPVTIELTGEELDWLRDGRLNLATDDNLVVDWAVLDLAIGPALALSTESSSIAEDRGMPLTATVERQGQSGELEITLLSSEPGLVQVPQAITIPDGQSSATFPVEVIDNAMAQGTVRVEVSAQAVETGSALLELTVTDDDVAALTLQLEPDSIDEDGGATLATVVRNTPLDTELIVRIDVSDPSRVTFPIAVAIPSGQVATTFQMFSIDNERIEGDALLQVQASAAAMNSAEASFLILEDDAWTWTNPINPFDVNEDGFVSAIDALIVINFLNNAPEPQFPPPSTKPDFFYDVSEDGFASAIDALMVINELNAPGGTAEGEGHALVFGMEEEWERWRRLGDTDWIVARLQLP